MYWIIPLSILIIFEVIADIFAKQWSLVGKPYLWIAAISAYVIGNIFWLFALKNGSGLSRGAIIFSLVSEILAISVGLFYYHESVTGTQLMGMGLGVVSLALLFWN